MIRTVLIPLLAVAGLLLAVVTVIRGSRPPEVALPVVEPARAPFDSFVAGSGLIESSSQNIAMGNPVAGTVAKVGVTVGDSVKAGDVLFELDTRDLKAELGVREATLASARAQLERLKSMPRPEEVPAAEAKVTEAEATLADMQNQLNLWEKITDRRAVSEDDLSRKRFAVAVAQSRLVQARSSLALLQAGAWKSDLAVAEAQIAGAEASVASTKTELDRRLVRSPVDGRVLQVNIRAGEFAPAGITQTPMMLVGTVDPLHVRVDVDENDAWRVRADARAIGYLRGHKETNSALRFVRFEPFVVPKRSLTGESTERVDTRVLQVIFAFDRADLGVYVGQQMDIYIEAAPLEKTGPARLETPAPGAQK